MLKVYLDESGIHSGAEVCVVAGYGNSVAKWKKFEAAWMRRISKAGLREFKASEFFDRNADGSGRGNYKSWDGKSLTAFFNDLISIINATDPKLLGSVMPVQHFLNLSREQRQYLTGGRWHFADKKFLTDGAPKRWFHAPMQNLLFIAHHEARKGNTKAHFVCDQQKQYAPYVLQRFREIKKNRPELLLGDLTYGESHEIGALQAADLVAYLCAQYGANRLKGIKQNSYEFGRILPRYERVDYLDKEALLHLCKGMTETDLRKNHK